MFSSKAVVSSATKRFALAFIAACTMALAFFCQAFAVGVPTQMDSSGGMLSAVSAQPHAQAVQKISTWSGSLFSQDSTIYNNNLALKAAEMCENSYPETSKKIMRKFGEYKFIDAKSYNYRGNYIYGENRLNPFEIGSNNSAFSVGHCEKTIGGKRYAILVVVARGTQSIQEMVGDVVKLPVKSFLGKKVWNNVHSFCSQVSSGVSSYVSHHAAVKEAARKGRLKVLVTGHSLGGAAANMYAAKLTKNPPKWAGKLKKGDVYAYTFGAICVLTKNANIEFGYENIHNVYNKYDSFGPWGPKWRLEVSEIRAKFGHTELFDIGKLSEGVDAVHNHNMTRYIEALKRGKVKCAEEKLFKIIFCANGGKGKMSTQTIQYGKKTVLKFNKFKRTGYRFTGWNTKKNGKGKTYKDEAKVKNLAKAGKTVKLYAQWRKTAVAKSAYSPRYYEVSTPSAWSGKVDRVKKRAVVAMIGAVDSKTGKTVKTYRYYCYADIFYLKGHKGDSRYWVATVHQDSTHGPVGDEGRKAWRSCHESLELGVFGVRVTERKKMGAGADEPYVYVTASNIPALIGCCHDTQSGVSGEKIPPSQPDQEALLKLTVGSAITYENAKNSIANARADNVSYMAAIEQCSTYVVNYLKPKF